MVDDAQNEPEKQFIIGKSLIEGINDFPKDINLGIKYINESIKNNFLESKIYYSEILIKGDIISQDLVKANEIISQINPSQDPRIYSLKGKISKKLNKNSEAIRFFEEGIKADDLESIYQYGKMFFLGEFGKKNIKESFKYFQIAKEKGYKKCELFLSSYDELSKIKGFLNLPEETQLLFINNIMKNNDRKFHQILIQPQKTEKLFYNKSLKSNYLYNCLNKYFDVDIEIEFPSASFKQIFDLVTKIKNKKVKFANVGIIFKSLQEEIPKECFSDHISYTTIAISEHTIPTEVFKDNKSFCHL